MHPTSPPSTHTKKLVASLREQALAYPEAHEDFPWGHSAFKVKGKAFAFVHADGDGLSISVKLPDSNALALELPFAEPTGYGLGKSGWVTARFSAKEAAPKQMLSAWLEESYAAIAPKRLLAALLASQGSARPRTDGGARSEGRDQGEAPDDHRRARARAETPRQTRGQACPRARLNRRSAEPDARFSAMFPSCRPITEPGASSSH